MPSQDVTHEKHVQTFDLVKNNLYLNVQGQMGMGMAAHGIAT